MLLPQRNLYLFNFQYGQYDQYDPQQQGPPEHLQRQFGGYDNY